MIFFGRKERRAKQDAAMLAVFQANPDSEFYALDLIREEHISSWSIYSTLIRLHERELIVSRWAEKEFDAKYRRRLYRLAPDTNERSEDGLPTTSTV